VEEFDSTEAQLIHDNLTVKGLSKYVVSKLRNFSCVRLRPMPRPESLAFNLMPMCISLHLLIDCLGKKTLALFLLSRFSLFTSLLRLINILIVSESTATLNQTSTCSSSDARFIISDAKEPATSTGGAILVEIQSCATVTT